MENKIEHELEVAIERAEHEPPPPEADATLDPIEHARRLAERPPVIGYTGQDDAFATESHPEGLRYGEAPQVAGTEYHGKDEAPAGPQGKPKPVTLSLGDET